MSPKADIREYALEQTSSLLGRLVFQVRRAVKSRDAEAVHDLRVAIRRFSRALRVFGQFFPRREARKIRQRLRNIMAAAGSIRDQDIALEYFDAAGIAAGSALRQRAMDARREAEREFVDLLKYWLRRDFSGRWRTRLHLSPP